MGLQLTHETAQGVSGNYWRVSEVYIHPKNEQVRAELCLFVDKAASDAGKTCLLKHIYDWGSTEYTSHFTPAVLATVDMDPQERAYELIKTLTDPADFSTATDV